MTLRLELLSAGTFSSGVGTPAEVDTDTLTDAIGLPFIRGKILKGLLVEACADIMFALSELQVHKEVSAKQYAALRDAAKFLFGQPGSLASDKAKLSISSATIATELIDALKYALEHNHQGFSKEAIRSAFSYLRAQTSVTVWGLPERGSLRQMRVIRKGECFFADLSFGAPLDTLSKGLLAACVLSVHRAGTARNRGPGRLKLTLHEKQVDITQSAYESFKAEFGSQYETA